MTAFSYITPRGYLQKVDDAFEQLFRTVSECRIDSVFTSFKPLDLCPICYQVFEKTHEIKEVTITILS